MAFYLFGNNANGTLASGINDIVTTIVLTAGHGARFPIVTAGNHFMATLIDPSNNLEIVKVTARSTDTLTVVRGQEGTIARSYSAGHRIEARVTAGALAAFLQVAGGVLLSNLGILSARGDLLTHNGTDHVRKAVGSAGQSPVADPTQADGLAWRSLFTTGDAKLTLKAVADAGWVMADDGTIGNATSGASTRANADTADLYALLWTNCSNTDCPVSGGRGGSAASDFAANKAIALPKALGRALAAAGSGFGLTARPLGSTSGAEAVTLGTTNLPAHNHPVVDGGHAHGVNDPAHAHGVDITNWSTGGGNPGFIGPGAGGSGTESWGTNVSSTGVTIQANTTGITTGNTGGGTAHNNVQPSTFLNVMIKL